MDSVTPQHLAIEKELIRFEEKYHKKLQSINKKLQSIDKKLQDLTVDSELGATLYLNDVASEVLLWAYGDQPAYQARSHSFQKFANGHDSKLAAYASSLPLSPPFDGIINRRSSAVHFKDMQGFQQAVQDVVGLLARHPALRRCSQHEAMVIDSFAVLKTVFNL